MRISSMTPEDLKEGDYLLKSNNIIGQDEDIAEIAECDRCTYSGQSKGKMYVTTTKLVFTGNGTFIPFVMERDKIVEIRKAAVKVVFNIGIEFVMDDGKVNKFAFHHDRDMWLAFFNGEI